MTREDIYGNAYVAPEWSGLEDEDYDPELLADNIIGLDDPVSLALCEDDDDDDDDDEEDG